MGLLFACDIRIATKEAHFSFPEVKRGIVPALISAFIVPQLGLSLAKQFMLTGERITAQELHRLGALTAVAETAEDMDKIITKYVQELQTSAPKAMAQVKALTQFVNCHTHSENLKEVQSVFAKTVHSPEALHGISAFLQREKPDWITFHKSKL